MTILQKKHLQSPYSTRRTRASRATVVYQIYSWQRSGHRVDNRRSTTERTQLPSPFYFPKIPVTTILSSSSPSLFHFYHWLSVFLSLSLSLTGNHPWTHIIHTRTSSTLCKVITFFWESLSLINFLEQKTQLFRWRDETTSTAWEACSVSCSFEEKMTPFLPNLTRIWLSSQHPHN